MEGILFILLNLIDIFSNEYRNAHFNEMFALLYANISLKYTLDRK